jgi:glycosyltransferase involved in cell wall biosynthesis
MDQLALSFHSDGAAAFRAAARAAWAGAEPETLNVAQTPWRSLPARLLRLRRRGGRVFCEQVPPPIWAAWLKALGLAGQVTILAQRWPQRGERAQLTRAAWWFPTPRLARAWREAGVPVERCTVIETPCIPIGCVERSETHHGPRHVSGCLNAAHPFAARSGARVERNLILWAGPLVRRTRARSMLWAFDILAYLDSEAHLLIAGSGPEEAALRAFADGLGPRQRVRLSRALTDADWERAGMAWVNDSTTATPDLWRRAHDRRVPCLVARPHAATALLPAACAPLPAHDPPAWAKAAAELLARWRPAATRASA